MCHNIRKTTFCIYNLLIDLGNNVWRKVFAKKNFLRKFLKIVSERFDTLYTHIHTQIPTRTLPHIQAKKKKRQKNKNKNKKPKTKEKQ